MTGYPDHDSPLRGNSTRGASIVKAFADGYREQRAKTPHILICDAKMGDWEGEGPICATACYCWCHL